MPRKLYDVIVKPISITFERSWWSREAPEGLEESKCNPYLQERQEVGSRELQFSQSHLSPGEGDWANNPRNSFQTHERKDGDWSSQHGFKKRKSCLINPAALHNKTTSLVDEGREVTAAYFDFSKAFRTVSHNILIDELSKYGWGKWKVVWIENWLNCRAWRAMISDMKSSCKPFCSMSPDQWSMPETPACLQ